MLSRPWKLCVALVGALAVVVAGCGGSGSSGGGTAKDPVEIRYLVANGDQTVKPAEALVKAFNAQNPTIKVSLETRPQGGEGDNVVKTRLSTQEMAEVFEYNSGSLLQALRPEQTLHPLDDQPWVGKLVEAFTPGVTANGKVYGAPFGPGFGGGVLYNRKIYQRLNLEIPKTWGEFMANSAKIKAAGIDPVIQSYGDTWTSQVPVLGDFHNIAAQDPDWAKKYTANQVKYAQEPSVEGFRHLEEVHRKGYLNKNFASVKVNAALSQLANGKGAQYPMLTVVVPNLQSSDPDKINDVGFFPLPGTDPSTNGMTLWLPNSNYIPKNVEGAKLEAAKKFIAFTVTPQGCKTFGNAFAPTGPYMVQGCELPADVPQAVKDLEPWTQDGKSTPALEFLSPVKGPALEQITVEVGSGLRSASAGAKLYDEDVKKQAQQLGLKGW